MTEHGRAGGGGRRREVSYGTDDPRLGTVDRQRTFAELLRWHRNSRGTTQQQLAELSTVSVRTIRDLELGRVSRPRQDTVRLIADGLGLGGRERADLEVAARQVTMPAAVKLIYDAEPTPPPAVLGGLVGRETELAVLSDMLGAGGQRLVTITGVSGVGKTVLALEIAAALHQRDGLPVLWSAAQEADAHAAGGGDPFAALIRSAVGGLFAHSDTALADLRGLVGQRPALLVLDGYDPRAVRMERVVALLRECRELRVLATTRIPFDLPGERVFPLAPLPTPSENGDHNLAALARIPSVRLLVTHVREVCPDFVLGQDDAAAVAALVRRFDGIPAALAAVASWFLLDQPAGLCAYAQHDPFGLLVDTLPDLPAALGETVAGLRPAEAAALGVLTRALPGWTMSDAVALTGTSAVTCARLVRRLLLLGLVRPVDQSDRARFQVLDLVRALPADRAPAHSAVLEKAL